jgi:hypothetical protein
MKLNYLGLIAMLLVSTNSGSVNVDASQQSRHQPSLNASRDMLTMGATYFSLTSTSCATRQNEAKARCSASCGSTSLGSLTGSVCGVGGTCRCSYHTDVESID